MSAPRPRIVAEARTWIGTPYRIRQRTRGLGVDCAELIAGIGEGLGWRDQPDYAALFPRDPEQLHVVKAVELGMALMDGRRLWPYVLAVKPWAGILLPGDVIVRRTHIGGDPRHAAILVDGPGPKGLRVVEAHEAAGRVVETEWTEAMERLTVAAWRWAI